jgi:hypothetical protein
VRGPRTPPSRPAPRNPTRTPRPPSTDPGPFISSPSQPFPTLSDAALAEIPSFDAGDLGFATPDAPFDLGDGDLGDLGSPDSGGFDFQPDLGDFSDFGGFDFGDDSDDSDD